MNLPILSSDNAAAPWYADGLKFTCTQCGNCCTGGPGYVWISVEEIRRLAEYLSLTPEQTIRKYCRKVGGRYSLKEQRGPGGWDCVFLKEQGPAPNGAIGHELKPGEPVPMKRRGCSIYPVRPLQCRTWPFWAENVESQERWDHSARKCHGMNHGHRHFTREQIETLRDAPDWPQDPPTSAAQTGKQLNCP